MFTAASGVVAFEQERQHDGSSHPKDQISEYFFTGRSDSPVEVNGDKLVLCKQYGNTQGQNRIGTLQEMYRQKTLKDLSLI